jgi:hypothetical protein
VAVEEAAQMEVLATEAQNLALPESLASLLVYAQLLAYPSQYGRAAAAVDTNAWAINTRSPTALRFSCILGKHAWILLSLSAESSWSIFQR